MPVKPTNPVAGVSICVIREGEVLLVQRAKKLAYGLWSLPGGHVKLGETVRDAALRELAEETAIKAEIVRQLDTVDIIPSRPGRQRGGPFHSQRLRWPLDVRGNPCRRRCRRGLLGAHG